MRQSVVVAAVLLLAVAAIIYLQRPPARPSLFFEQSFDRAKWTARIESVGGEEAYREFKAAYGGDPNSHTAMHFIGDLLYRTLGLQGFSICDDSFGYGCYHQYMMDMLQEQGAARISDIEQLCMEASTAVRGGCLHGVGHGLAEYYRTDLVVALRACEHLSGEYPTRICTDGVFMEHNVPTMTEVGATNRSVRQFDPKHPLAPCDTTPMSFGHSCYFALPHLWFSEPDTTFEKIAARCASAPEDFRNDCYKGIGIDLPGTYSYDGPRIVAACSEISAVEGERLCLEESAQTLVSLSHDASVVRAALK